MRVIKELTRMVKAVAEPSWIAPKPVVRSDTKIVAWDWTGQVFVDAGEKFRERRSIISCQSPPEATQHQYSPDCATNRTLLAMLENHVAVSDYGVHRARRAAHVSRGAP